MKDGGAAKAVKVLLLEDSDLDADLIQAHLAKAPASLDIARAVDRTTFVQALEREEYDVILSDYSLPGFDGVRALEIAREKTPGTPFIFVSGILGEEVAIESFNKGATDYVLKQRLVRLPAAVTRALAESNEKSERRHSEALFRTLADNIPILCCMARADGHVFWYNQRWYDYTGTSPEAQEGWGWQSVHNPDVLPAVIERWQKSVASGEPFEMTFPLRAADGSFRPFLTRVVPIRDERGEILRWFGTNTDVSEQLATEARLQNLNATLKERVAEEVLERDRLWRNSLDLLVVIDMEGRFQAVSPVVTSILGWTPEEMIGHTVFDFTMPDDHAATISALAHATGDALPAFENRYRHKDGGFRWISWVAAPKDGLIYATGRHVTDEKAAAAELEAAQEALRQSQKMDAVGQLTGGVAHDFNNLLTIIIGNLDILQRRIPEDAERLRRSAENAMQGARRAATLTRRLLAFSRRQPLQPKSLSVNAVVAGMSEMFERTLGEEIDIETVLAGGLWNVEADPSELEAALLNLAVNARHAMPSGGKLTIETANSHLDSAYASAQSEVAPGQYVAICVSDTGTGMSREVLEKIFEPFFTTKEVGQGTGLGLSQVYGFVKQSGGHVKAYSEVGEGTSIKIYLPRVDGVDGTEDVAESHAIPGGVSAETILVVEDDPEVRAYSVEVLSDLGYRVVQAADGPSALRLLGRESDIALLFTDVVLPGGMSGRVLADQIVAARPGIKVLYTSGYSRNAIVHQGRLDAGVHLISKPFTYSDLAVKVRDMLDGAR